MTGFGLEVTFDDVQIANAVTRLEQFPGARQRDLMDAIGNAGVTKTKLRFRSQAGPDGTPWLQSQRAKRDGGRTLHLHGYLENSIVHNLLANGVEWGSGLVYALIHQLGGVITSRARSQKSFRKVGKDGSLSARFVKAKNANFQQWLTIPEFQIRMPARPYVGLDQDDRAEIQSLGARHLQAALLGTTVAALGGRA